MSRDDCVLDRMKGPVVPLKLCFKEDESLDYYAIRKYVNWLCENKAPIIMLTSETSEYASLTEDEVFRLTEEIAEINGGRSVFITSTGYWPPFKCREFLRHADNVGADAVKVQIHREHGGSRQVIVNYYDSIQDVSDIPLLLWVVLEDFSVDTITELAGRPHIIGMKNDADQFYFYYNALVATASKKFAVISGGQMKNFIYGYQNGSPAYLCPIAPFRPDISLKFCDELYAGRLKQAWQYIHTYEDPWLEASCGLGWHNSVKSALKAYGLYPNNRPRLPRIAHTEEQYEKIRESLRTIFGLDAEKHE